MKISKLFNFFIPIISVSVLIIGVILFPNKSINAAKNGLEIWVNVLIPSLLPFVIGANLMVYLKFVDILGFFLNPITKLVFKVSGKSALVFAISTVSGYPVGAKLASELRNNNEISKYEAQRLVAFCSTSGPLFIIGSVATGMFRNISLGYLMIFCHYLGSISVGLLFRNYGREKLEESNYSLINSIKNVINSRRNDGFFILFGNAVYSGVNTLLLVGGFVIVFSVVFEVCSIFNIISFMSNSLYIISSNIGVSKDLCHAFISGLFEMTIGCANVSALTNEPEIIRAALTSFLMAFSGLSILAQCSSFIAKTDLNVKLYILSKFLHGIFAGIFTFLLYPVTESVALVSNFTNVYNSLYNNSLWISYINNYKIILPLIVIIYLVSSLYILNKKRV